jgi:hypothetical protein
MDSDLQCVIVPCHEQDQTLATCLRIVSASALLWHHKTQPRNAATDDLVIDLPAGAILHKVRLRGFPVTTTQNIFQLQLSF